MARVKLTKEEQLAKLRAITLSKRGMLLKDRDTTDLLVLCDKAEEDGISADLPGRSMARGPYEFEGQIVHRIAYLKWASKAQIEALSERIPSITYYAVGRFGRHDREVTAFDAVFLEHLLTDAVTDPAKYIVCDDAVFVHGYERAISKNHNKLPQTRHPRWRVG